MTSITTPIGSVSPSVNSNVGNLLHSPRFPLSDWTASMLTSSLERLNRRGAMYVIVHYFSSRLFTRAACVLDVVGLQLHLLKYLVNIWLLHPRFHAWSPCYASGVRRRSNICSPNLATELGIVMISLLQTYGRSSCHSWLIPILKEPALILSFISFIKPSSRIQLNYHYFLNLHSLCISITDKVTV
jgi:hypothetical protein